MDLQRWGFDLDDFEVTAVVWPENRQAVRVFIAMSTQWLCGPAGYIGLSFPSLAEVWRRLKVPPAERDAVFHDLRVLEAAALNEMHKGD